MTSILAIDIGGTNTKLAPVDPAGKTGTVVSIPTSEELGLESFLNSIVDAARIIISEKTKINGVGIGVAGFIDLSHTTMTFNPNIAWLEGVNLGDYFSRNLNLPVSLEIDSNAAALAEAVHGNGKDSKRLLVLSLGTGLGGGMVVDGNILRISNECLGDIGHVIVEPGGSQCAAGCRGCAEAMVSVSALERYAVEFMSEDTNSIGYDLLKKGGNLLTPDIIKTAQLGDQAAVKAIQKLGKYLGIALASMTPVLAPDRICIAGGISEAGGILLDAIQISFLGIVGPPYAKGVIIQKALLGWRAVLVGSAEVQRKEQRIDREYPGL
jgi:glucokinase